ncbi:hypothetical protein HDU67_006236 [Dinochytrium kinnereticum]|nr:hypothetical protein HDU67_006236 [Dinochytrium kinnereticum]
MLIVALTLTVLIVLLPVPSHASIALPFMQGSSTPPSRADEDKAANPPISPPQDAGGGEPKLDAGSPPLAVEGNAPSPEEQSQPAVESQGELEPMVRAIGCYNIGNIDTDLADLVGPWLTPQSCPDACDRAKAYQSDHSSLDSIEASDFLPENIEDPNDPKQQDPNIPKDPPAKPAEEEIPGEAPVTPPPKPKWEKPTISDFFIMAGVGERGGKRDRGQRVTSLGCFCLGTLRQYMTKTEWRERRLLPSKSDRAKKPVNVPLGGDIESGSSPVVISDEPSPFNFMNIVFEDFNALPSNPELPKPRTPETPADPSETSSSAVVGPTSTASVPGGGGGPTLTSSLSSVGLPGDGGGSTVVPGGGGLVGNPQGAGNGNIPGGGGVATVITVEGTIITVVDATGSPLTVTSFLPLPGVGGGDGAGPRTATPTGAFSPTTTFPDGVGGSTGGSLPSTGGGVTLTPATISGISIGVIVLIVLAVLATLAVARRRRGGGGGVIQFDSNGRRVDSGVTSPYDDRNPLTISPPPMSVKLRTGRTGVVGAETSVRGMRGVSTATPTSMATSYGYDDEEDDDDSVLHDLHGFSGTAVSKSVPGPKVSLSSSVGGLLATAPPPATDSSRPDAPPTPTSSIMTMSDNPFADPVVRPTGPVPRTPGSSRGVAGRRVWAGGRGDAGSVDSSSVYEEEEGWSGTPGSGVVGGRPGAPVPGDE